MSERSQLNRIKWRQPTEDEKKRLAYADSRNKVASYILLGVLIIMIVIPLIYIKDIIFMMNNNAVGLILAGAFYLFLMIFLILRIHLVSKYQVADVIVDEIVVSTSSESGCAVTATVSQGDVLLTGVGIAMKENPEEGSPALLYIENNDTWSVGIVEAKT